MERGPSNIWGRIVPLEFNVSDIHCLLLHLFVRWLHLSTFPCMLALHSTSAVCFTSAVHFPYACLCLFTINPCGSFYICSLLLVHYLLSVCCSFYVWYSFQLPGVHLKSDVYFTSTFTWRLLFNLRLQFTLQSLLILRLVLSASADNSTFSYCMVWVAGATHRYWMHMFIFVEMLLNNARLSITVGNTGIYWFDFIVFIC